MSEIGFSLEGEARSVEVVDGEFRLCRIGENAKSNGGVECRMAVMRECWW